MGHFPGLRRGVQFAENLISIIVIVILIPKSPRKVEGWQYAEGRHQLREQETPLCTKNIEEQNHWDYFSSK